MDFGLKREFRVKFMLKKVGMSVINFGSKKRKVVIGIEFDWLYWLFSFLILDRWSLIVRSRRYWRIK